MSDLIKQAQAILAAYREKLQGTAKKVLHGERLSGQGSDETGFPEIWIMSESGDGPESGSLLSSLTAFHFVEVTIKGELTELWIEGKLCVTAPTGHVLYCGTT